MTPMRLRSSVPLALAAVVLTLAACKKNDAAATDSTATSGTPMAADSTATSGTPAAATTMPMDSTAMRDSAMKHDSAMKRDTMPSKKP